MKNKYQFIIIVLLFLLPRTASADIIWPALFLEQGMLKWWVIIAGLVLEWGFLKGFLEDKCKWAESLKLAIVMNAVSSSLGVLLIPLGGVLLEFFPGSLLHYFFKSGTLSNERWFLTILLASFINALIERWVIIKFFKKRFTFRKSLFWFFVVNLVTVGMAVASLILKK